jgi:cbb3-type cytochrome oxidase maturation protein
MSVMYFLIGFSLLIATGFVLAFVWAIRNGQYDDKYTPSVRMLFDDVPVGNDENSQKSNVLESNEGGKKNDGEARNFNPTYKDKDSKKSIHSKSTISSKNSNISEGAGSTRNSIAQESAKNTKVSRISTTPDTDTDVENNKDSNSINTSK